LDKKIYENGIQSLSNDEYHSSAGLSRSALMRFKRSPMHYWYEYESGDFVKPESTPALILGDVVHTLVLEPHLYAERYAIQPVLPALPKVGLLRDVGRDIFETQKAARAAMEAQNDAFGHEFLVSSAGKMVISADVAAKAVAMAGAIQSHDIARDLFQDCLFEQSIYFSHENTGIQLKARPDAMSGSIVIDLKTSLDASYRGIQNSAYKYGYFLQSGFIHQALKSIGIEMEKFIIVAVEKEPPFAVGIYILDQEAIDYGVNQLNELMAGMTHCIENKNWPSYPIKNLSVPNFAKYDLSIDVEDYD
jgi:hypothetical protein